MNQLPDPFQTLRPFCAGHYYSLKALEERGFPGIRRLPVSIRIVLESLLRNCDGQRVTREDVEALARYDAKAPSPREVPFVVSRIVLQDFTGVPLLVDLAAMRQAVHDLGADAAVIEPLVPVDLVVDHSVQVDRSGSPHAFRQNLEIEFGRNRERYEFLKWGQQAFKTFSVVPPAIGIVHQVNLEYLAKLVFEKDGLYFPDSLVGTDSHTTMINGLGVVGWGVGGIEAEAGMLGQPISFATPEVVGVHLTGALREGVTATDLVLRITEMLRKAKVVDKFVEFFGEGAARLGVPDRATIGNMAPEYGATMGFFPVDEKTLDYLRLTGRGEELISLVRDYYQAQGLFGIPRAGEVDYSQQLELDLGSITPSVSGPKRPQDRIDLTQLHQRFASLLRMPVAEGGYGLGDEALKATARIEHTEGDHEEVTGGFMAVGSVTDPTQRHQVEMVANRPATARETADHKPAEGELLRHGSVVIAAITSCTNTSNPSVMLGAALLAKKAVERGLRVPSYVKTSLAPGSRVVTEYLQETGLQRYLDALGFHLVGYGCTTCIGNSGPLDEPIESAIERGKIVAAAVLSGNRNFEARIHAAIKANFLMSPPLVVAFALAGRIDLDLDREPLGIGSDGKPVFLRELWPTSDEVQAAVARGIQPRMFVEQYSDVLDANPDWKAIEASEGALYRWRDDSTYIQLPPFFADFSTRPGTIGELRNLRALGIFGDSVTTDHISPAGSIPEDGPAGKYLRAHGVAKDDFNSFGSRRGNDRVMTRGTFANVRIKNLMAGGREGGYTRLMPEGDLLPIFEAAEAYHRRGTGLIVFAGADYGMGSSRDWAAKGTRLLGVRAVVAKSFERIHRSNLIGMGVLPLTFPSGVDAASLKLTGSETFSLLDLADNIPPRSTARLRIERASGEVEEVRLAVRLDTAIEVEYYRHGGILPYVLRHLVQQR